MKYTHFFLPVLLLYVFSRIRVLTNRINFVSVVTEIQKRCRVNRGFFSSYPSQGDKLIDRQPIGNPFVRMRSNIKNSGRTRMTFFVSPSSA